MNPYVNRVLLRREYHQGDPPADVLIGGSADLRVILGELLAAIDRLEGQAQTFGEPQSRFHHVTIGDAGGRWDIIGLGIRVDADVDKYRRGTGWILRFFDSNAAALPVLIVLTLAVIGARTVWQWWTAT